MKRISIIGAGTMGRGIVQLCAQYGFEVFWYDLSTDILNHGMNFITTALAKAVERGKIDRTASTQAISRITIASNIESLCNTELVIEAVPEILSLKQEIFSKICQITSKDTILASNTSSLSISAIASATTSPDRVIGLHFFNPVPAMRLLEIVRGSKTSEEILQRSIEFGKIIRKETIVVSDTPGFATSRLGLALGLEAMRMFENKIASAEDIDRAMELGYNHPIGPLKLTDLIGLDVRLNIATYLYKELKSEVFNPPNILRKLVSEGKLGKKTSQGFYSWESSTT